MKGIFFLKTYSLCGLFHRSRHHQWKGRTSIWNSLQKQKENLYFLELDFKVIGPTASETYPLSDFTPLFPHSPLYFCPSLSQMDFSQLRMTQTGRAALSNSQGLKTPGQHWKRIDNFKVENWGIQYQNGGMWGSGSRGEWTTGVFRDRQSGRWRRGGGTPKQVPTWWVWTYWYNLRVSLCLLQFTESLREDSSMGLCHSSFLPGVLDLTTGAILDKCWLTDCHLILGVIICSPAHSRNCQCSPFCHILHLIYHVPYWLP